MGTRGIGRRIYAAVGLFATTLVMGAVVPGSSVEAASPPIEIVGLRVPKTLSQIHDGMLFLDEDPAGNIYFGGGANLAGWVWKATPNGRVTRFAGTGVSGFSRDGGAAIQLFGDKMHGGTGVIITGIDSALMSV